MVNIGETTETSGFEGKTTTTLEVEAPPKRTKYLSVSAVVMLVLTFGVLFLIVITSKGHKANHKEAIEVTEADEPEKYVYKRRKATAPDDKGTNGHRKKSKKSSSTTAKADEKIPKATIASPSSQTEIPAKETSPPARQTKKPAENAKPRKASAKPFMKPPVTSTDEPAKAENATLSKGLPPELGERPLVCAYGNGSHDPLVLPADGLCDAVFFDSLYKYPGYVLSNVDNASLVQLGSFLKHAKKYKRTRFGMGVAAQYVKSAEAEFASNTAERHYLPYLWTNKVYDLGVLDFIPDENMNADDVNVLFNLLKEYKRLQSLIPQEGGLKAYMVLGIALFKNYEGIYEAFNNQMRDNVVDVLILRTHFSGRDESRKDCVIQGSTYWKGSLTQYHPSLNYTLMYMANNKNKFGRAKMLISMSLAGRWYKSLVGGKNKNAYMVGGRCQPYGSKEYLYELQKFTRVTEDPTYGTEHTFLDEKRFVMVSYDPAEGYALLFDSAVTIYMKMCLSYTVQLGVPFGLALFDAEYDQWSKEGNKAGSFPLTRSARKAVDDIKYNAADNSTEPFKCVAPE